MELDVKVVHASWVWAGYRNMWFVTNVCAIELIEDASPIVGEEPRWFNLL